MNIGIFGTFDLLNYGDLLFPIIAEAELRERLGEVKVIPYSYRKKTTSDWPYDVKRLGELDSDWPALDGVVIGGGHLIRFDSEIAPGYYPENPEELAHPEAYWLAPALAAVQKNVPVCWNAPSASLGLPGWGRELIGEALKKSEYCSVRDTASALELDGLGANLQLVPDSAFGVDRVFKPRQPSEKPYLIIQANPSLRELIDGFKQSDLSKQYDIYFLPVCVCLDDGLSTVSDLWPEAIGLELMPDLESMAAWIGGAAGVVAASLHLSITALTYGVPVLRRACTADGKYAFLQESPRVFWTREPQDQPYQSFLEALGTRCKCGLALSAASKLKKHWDQIASIFLKGAKEKHPESNFGAINRRILLIKKTEAKPD
jgi:lipopolysaccharide transport system ATP-binding protein